MEKKRQNNIPHDIVTNRIYFILVLLANIFSLHIARQSFTYNLINKSIGIFVILTAILIDFLFYNIVISYSNRKRRKTH